MQCNYHAISQWLFKCSWTYYNLVIHSNCKPQFDWVWITHSLQQNEAKLEFENFTYTKKCKNENTQITTWRCTDRRCKGTGKTVEGSFEFPSTNPHYHEANPAKKELVQIEKAIESRAVQSLEPPRVVVQVSTNNSTGEAVAQLPNQRTMLRRIQRRRVVAHIPNPLSTSVLNVPDDLRTTIRGEPFYAFDSGKEDPNRIIKGSLGYVHPTIFKFIDFLRREQSAAENKLISLEAGKEFLKNARYQKKWSKNQEHPRRLPKQSNWACT